MTTGVWHHGAVTYDGTWHLYLDGVDVTSTTNQTVNQPPNDLIQNLTTIGSSRETGGALDGFFAGIMDEVRIWSVARSQAQIQGSMNTEMTSPTANLAGRWGLDEGTGSTIADSSGNGIERHDGRQPDLGRRLQRRRTAFGCRRTAVRRLE